MSDDTVGAALGITMMIGFLLVLVLLTFMLGMTDIFGISFGLRWNLANSGTEVRTALTPKLGDIEIRNVFLGEGEQMNVDLDFQIEEGHVSVVASDLGWGPGGHYESLWDVGGRSPTRTTRTITAPHAGFYGVGGMLNAAQGDFRIDWTVTNARPGPTAFRTVLMILSHLWLVILLGLLTAATIWRLFS
jgi:hypothetical protein